MNDHKYIEDLIVRFFDGYTSNEEEKKLYVFFSQKDIPEHLVKYKPIFEYFENSMQEEFSSNIEKPVIVQKSSNNRKLYTTLISIAASVLIIFTIQLYSQKTIDPYEGSYIIRNGVKITNLDEIRDQLEAVEQAVLQKQSEAEELLEGTCQDDKYSSIIEEKIKLLEEKHNNFINNAEDKIKESLIKNE